MAKLPSSLKRNVALLDVHAHVGVDPHLYLTHAFPYSHSLRSAFEDCRRIGVTHSVIFPWTASVYYHPPSLQKGKVRLGGGIGKAPFHFENEQMLRQLYEIFPDYRSMFIPFVFIDTLRETRRQVRALEKLLSRYPFYGLKIHPRSTQAPMMTLAREGRVFLQFARAYDFPVLIHASSSIDPLSRVSDVLRLARQNPKLRFCAAHCCGFHQKLFEEADRMENVWVDSAAMSIGCDLVLQKSKVYESGSAKVPADYRRPSQVFAKLAAKFPDTFMWGTDNPAHSWVTVTRLKNGDVLDLRLWSDMEREKDLLREVRGKIRSKVAFANALRFIEG